MLKEEFQCSFNLEKFKLLIKNLLLEIKNLMGLYILTHKYVKIMKKQRLLGPVYIFDSANLLDLCTNLKNNLQREIIEKDIF